MENTGNIPTVQHVTKASSDELLSKFAEIGSDSKIKTELRLSKRLRRRGQTAHESDQCESPSGRRVSLGERSLLPPATRRSSAALIRRAGIGKGKLLRGRYFKNKSILGAIEKTWRRTIQGASKVFMEKHYNRHKLLINDAA